MNSFELDKLYSMNGYYYLFLLKLYFNIKFNLWLSNKLQIHKYSKYYKTCLSNNSKLFFSLEQ